MRGMLRPVTAALALVLTLAGATAVAQGVSDPTRPPQAVESPGDAPGSGLQSVLISETRKAAVIGGQLVELGQKYGDATLVRVTEGEVTLAKGREMRVLHLFPGIDKRMLTATPGPGAPVEVRKKSKSRGIK
jgi:MSHA biogenesis protein MshK